MLRDQIINFLEVAVVFLMLTNALSIAATAYALALVQRATRTGSRAVPLGLFASLPRWLRANNPTQRWRSAMSTVMTSFVSNVLFAKHDPSYGVDRGRWRWRRLTASLLDPYRPELHYMRGPGPKWREKHARGGGSAGFPV